MLANPRRWARTPSAFSFTRHRNVNYTVTDSGVNGAAQYLADRGVVWYLEKEQNERFPMSDLALKNAEAKRDGLAYQIKEAIQQVEDLRRELRTVEDFIRAWHEFAGAGIPPTVSHTNVQPLAEWKKIKILPADPKNPSRDEVRVAVRAILKMAKAPVPRQNLFNELKNRGLEIFGKDPEMVLSTMMWRMQDEFVRLRNFGYWFRDLPFEPAEYNPPIPSSEDVENAENSNQSNDLSGKNSGIFD